MIAEAPQHRLLIIDDDERLRRSIRMQLEPRGYAVEEAASAAEGIARIDLGGIDLALLDMKLPDSRDLEALQEIRRRHPDVEVIVITGYGGGEIANAVFAQGANYYGKPILDWDLFESWCRQALERRKLSAQVKALERQVGPKAGGRPMLGRSRAMMRLMADIRQLSTVWRDILVVGASGLAVTVDIARVRVDDARL